MAGKDILEFVESSKNIIDTDSDDGNEVIDAASVPLLRNKEHHENSPVRRTGIPANLKYSTLIGGMRNIKPGEALTPHVNMLQNLGGNYERPCLMRKRPEWQRIALPPSGPDSILELGKANSAFHLFSGSINEHQACLGTKHWEFRVRLTS
ncbi:hypothetical protein TNCV_4428901 [Trichonephila clavipes]|nr:hypothetical protein TNCV_4428901 [Trichonephila clavipes]